MIADVDRRAGGSAAGGEDGGDLSSALFADAELRDIPVLFLTALASPQDLKRLAGQLGGRPAVSKSEPVDQLVARIEALLAR